MAQGASIGGQAISKYSIYRLDKLLDRLWSVGFFNKTGYQVIVKLI